MSQSACFFSVKSSAQLYSDRKPRACQKFGVGPGLDKCPAHGQRKTCKCPTPGTDKADKCPAVAGGGGGCWAHLDLTDALVHFWYILTFRRQVPQTNRMFMFQYSLPSAVQTLYKTMFLCNIPRHLKLSLLKNTC